MPLYYLLLFAIPFHSDPRLGMNLFSAGPIIVTPVKVLGLLAVASAWLSPQPEASVPRISNPMPLLFVPFAVIPIVVMIVFSLPTDAGQIGQLISTALLFSATRPLVRTQERMVNVTRVLVCAFAFSSLWVYKQYFVEHLSRPYGLENESNYEAMMLLLSIPMAFWMGCYERSSRWRRIGFACGLLLAGAAVLTQSRAGIIAGGTMGLLAAISSKRKVLGITVLAVAAVIVFNYGPAGISQRFRSIKFTGDPQNGDEDSSRIHVELLRAGLSMMEGNPIIGVGMGQFKALAPLYNPGLYQVSTRSFIAHDTLMQIGTERGVPVLLLFIAMIVVALHNFSIGRRSSDPALAALCLSMWIALIGICVATLSQSAELFPYFLFIILSQNLREVAYPVIKPVTQCKPATSTDQADCGNWSSRATCN
jgi:hypothetical protein